MICVEDNTSTLDDINILVLNESLSGPSRAVRVWIMVAIENGDNVGLDIQREEVVDIVCFGFRIWYLCNA